MRALDASATRRQQPLSGVLRAALAAVALSVAAPARAECPVSGERVELEDVVVRPAGAEPFILSLSGARARVILRSQRAAPARVDVERPFAFSGTRRGIWFFIATPQRTAALSIAPGALLRDARSQGSDVIGSLVLRPGSVPLDGDREPAEFVSDVRVPCAALTRDVHSLNQTPDSASPEADIVGDQTFWELRGTNLPVLLRLEPRWSAPSVRFGGTQLRHGPPLWFERLAERGGWMKVARRGEHALVVGWMDKSRLRPLEEAPPEAGCCADYDGRARSYHRTSAAPLVYKGFARVAPGAKVYSSPGRGLWATVAEPTRVHVQVHEGDTWIGLQEVPGLPGADAYVSADTVTFENPAR